MKKLLVLPLTLLLCTSSITNALATEQISVDRNKISIVVNGDPIDSDNFIYNGVTYVPLRVMSENLNSKVTYYDNIKTATIFPVTSDNNTELSSKYAEVNRKFMLTLNAKSISDNENSIYRAFLVTNPDFALSLSSNDFLDAMKNFDTVVGNANSTYNFIYQQKYTELYAAAEDLREMAFLLNDYASLLIDIKTGGSSDIYSAQNEITKKMNSFETDLKTELYNLSMNLLDAQ